MFRNTLITIFIFNFCFTTNLISQPLNADDLFNYAKENSPSLKNSTLDVELAKQQIKQTIASGLPKFNGGIGFQNYIDIPTTVVPASAFVPGADENELLGLQFGTDYNANYNVKVDQLLFSFTYLYGIKAANTYSALSDLIRVKTYEDLREKIKLAIGDHILIKVTKELIGENLKEIKILIEKTQSLINEGFLEKTGAADLLLVKLDLEAAKSELDANQEFTLINLKSIIGYPLDSNLLLIDSFDLSSFELIPFKIEAKNTNAVKISEQNLILNKINLKAAKSEGYPSIYGFFSHQQMAMRNQFNFFETQQSWYPATLWGFNINIPIFNSGEGKAKTQIKKIAVEKANNELKEIENQIIALLMILKNNYTSAFKRLQNSREKLSFSNEIYQNELLKFQSGASNLLLLTEKKTGLIQAQQELLQKELGLYKAKVQLEKYTKPLKL
jgi:outer membrane protein TolC